MPRVPREAPARAVPEMFSTEFLPVAGPVRAWSQADPGAAPSAATGLFPGWTGMHPAVATGGAAGVLATRPERRRRAIYAVLGIAAVTVLVLLAAVFLAPNWGGTGGTGVADKIGQRAGLSTAPASTPSAPGPTTPASSPTGAGGVPPLRTVTVTASTPKPTTAKPTPKPSTTAPALPLGVPQRNIACSGGYIVQLASELDQVRFKARVTELRSARQLPAGALAADSTKSCPLFTSQLNTVVLYAGPFTSKYDGCAARLAGPADAYIKGANADSAGEYVSCLCAASVAEIPRYTAVGQTGVWVGELQRVLGNRLDIEVDDLTGHWGQFTAETQAAVRAFQQSAQLPSNGIVDARTWAALRSAGC